jgi:hypothetical protein
VVEAISAAPHHPREIIVDALLGAEAPEATVAVKWDFGIGSESAIRLATRKSTARMATIAARKVGWWGAMAFRYFYEAPRGDEPRFWGKFRRCPGTCTYGRQKTLNSRTAQSERAWR